MLRELASLPTAPQRLLDDVHEIKLLVREMVSLHEALLATSHRRTASSTTRMSGSTCPWIELRGLNEGLERLDRRLLTVQEELLEVRNAVREIAEAVPDLGRGPIDKMKDAIGGT